MREPGVRYTIAVTDEVLSDLQARLSRTRWPRPPAGPNWQLGASLPYMQQLVAHWRTAYDWRAIEKRLNAIEQYRVPIDGLHVHAFVERGSGPSPLPIVLTHGWPGSPIELLRLVEPLAHPECFGGDVADAFTVVVPSLPGCGFSEPPPAPITPQVIARMWGKLMHEAFGFERYVAHGGDWGGAITMWMGAYKPAGLVGVHMTMAPVAPWTYAKTPPSAQELAHQQRQQARMAGENAYQLIQGTRPLSLAYAQADSPAGLAAWIVEKFKEWTVGRADVDPPFTLDEMTSNVMFYWLGDAQAMSWLYRTIMADPASLMLQEGQRVGVPGGLCLFPKDLIVPAPDEGLDRAMDVIHVTRAPSGGHFPGLENSDLLAKDIRAYARKLRAKA